jgi:hypothetical protein
MSGGFRSLPGLSSTAWLCGSGVLLPKWRLDAKFQSVFVGFDTSAAREGQFRFYEPAARSELIETLGSWFGKWLQFLRESIGPRPVKFPAEIGSAAGEGNFKPIR